ncbi:MAG: 4Fe-4S binding protein [Bacillota bacterium]|nr:4Fe-4S binding protein [Bacillota bacterium]
MAAVVDKELCTGCGICQETCPAGAITVDEVAHVDPDKCTECGACADECPFGAIAFEDRPAPRQD